MQVVKNVRGWRRRGGEGLGLPGEFGVVMDTLRMWQHLISGDRPPPPTALETFERALAMEDSGRMLDARELLQVALPALEAAEAPEAAVANHKLAVFELERGETDEAAFHAVRSVFLYNKCEDLGGIYAALHNLAVIHTERGEADLAETARTQSARARRELLARRLGHLAEQGLDCRGQRLRLLRRLPRKRDDNKITRSA